MAGSYYEVEVRPNADGWSAKLEAQIGPVMRQLAEQMRQRLNGAADDIAEHLSEKLKRAMRDGLGGGAPTVQGRQSATRYADAFDRELKTKLRASLSHLPEGNVRLLINGSAAERELAKVRAELGRITDANIGVDLTDKAALARIEELKVRLTRLTGPEHDIRVQVNSGRALAELEAIRLAAKSAGNTVNNLGSGGSTAGGPGVMVAGIVAGLTTVGPLAAAAAGGLLGAAGAAGVAGLAVMGFKRQMAEGVGVGQDLSEQFKGITREANGLADVAANAVGPGIRDVLDSVLQATPQFEGLVTLVGGRLGGAAREVGTALLTVFQKSQPLIVEVSGYLEDGAAALSRWVAGPSFDRFLTYARQQLPIVIGYAKDFGTAIVETFKAFTTTGEGVLKTLDLIAQGTSFLADHTHDDKGNSLFGNIFGYGWADNTKKDSNTATDAIDQLLADYQGFFNGTAKLTQIAAPLDQFKSITGDLTPQLKAAVGAGIEFSAAATGIVARLREATPELQTFMDTAAAFASTTTHTLTDTAKLLGDALTASRGFALDYTASLVGADTATLNLSKSVHDNLSSVAKDGTLLGVSHLDAAGKFVAAAGKYTQGSSDIASAFQAQVQAATDAATATYMQVKNATGDSVKAGNDALTVYKGLREQLIAQGTDAGLTAQQVQGLADSYFKIPPSVDTFVQLLGQNNVNLAINNLTDALNRLSDFIGAPTIGLNDTDLQNSRARIQPQLDYYGNLQLIPSLDLGTSGFDNKAAQSNGVLDVLGGRSVAPTVGINDQATSVVARVQSAINAMHGKTINLDIVARQAQGLDYYGNASAGTPGNPAASAYGNIFDTVGHYAAGGIADGLSAKMNASAARFARGAENHVPQIAMPNGGVRIWAEPETQGEAYIPFALDRRARAEDIVSQVASRFGGAYVRPTSMSAPSGSVVPAAGGSGGDLLAAIGALTARVGDVETAVYAGAQHTADRYDGAVDKTARTVGLASQQQPRRG